MLSKLFDLILSGMLWFALHIEEKSAFPKPLPPKEEAELFRLCARGDRSAREKLILHNLRLVAHIVKKYYAAPEDQEELISIGTVGLIKAVSTFDPSKGNRFAAYGSRCIENAILSQRNEIAKMLQIVYLHPKNGT